MNHIQHIDYQGMNIYAYLKNLLLTTFDYHLWLGTELIKLDSACKPMVELAGKQQYCEESCCCLLNAICIYASHKANAYREHHATNMDEYAELYLQALRRELVYIIELYEGWMKQ